MAGVTLLFVALCHHPVTLFLPKADAQVLAAAHHCVTQCRIQQFCFLSGSIREPRAQEWQFDFVLLVTPRVINKSAKLLLIVLERDVHRYKFWARGNPWRPKMF